MMAAECTCALNMHAGTSIITISRRVRHSVMQAVADVVMRRVTKE